MGNSMVMPSSAAAEVKPLPARYLQYKSVTSESIKFIEAHRPGATAGRCLAHIGKDEVLPASVVYETLVRTTML